MAKSGQVFKNPKSGETITFIKTSKDTNGEFVLFELECTKKGGVPFEHIHPLQKETFTIIEGSVYFKLNGKEVHVTAGNAVTVPPGAKHIFLNKEDKVLRAIVEVRPALRFENGIETIFGMATDGKCDEKGQPPFLQIAVLTDYSAGEFYLASLPIPIQKFLFGILSRIGRVLGYQAFYTRYSGFDA
jgi:quercetin dioxygenase-like cupin family protein